jgi:hypothetical protein
VQVPNLLTMAFPCGFVRVNKRNTLLCRRRNVGLGNSRGSRQIPLFKLQLFEALRDYHSHIHRIPPGLN